MECAWSFLVIGKRTHTMCLLSIYLNRFNVGTHPTLHLPGSIIPPWLCQTHENIIHVESLLFNYPSKSLFITRTAFCTLIISITRKLYLEVSVHQLCSVAMCWALHMCVCHPGTWWAQCVYVDDLCAVNLLHIFPRYGLSALWLCSTRDKVFCFSLFLFNLFRQFRYSLRSVSLCLCVWRFTLAGCACDIHIVRSWFVLAQCWRRWSSGKCSINRNAERFWHRPGECTTSTIYKYVVPL